RRIYDKENAKIFVTGSSSKLLSREIATNLRGRTLSYVLFPLSFKEFLEFKDFKLGPNYQFDSQRFDLKKLFNEYLEYGGFPEVVLGELKREILINYVDMIIYKDLIERYSIKNINLIKDLVKYITTNVSKFFSVRAYSMVTPFKSVKLNTLYNYVSYLVESFFCFQVPVFSYSLKSQQLNPKKMYLIDNGFYSVYSFRFSENKGRLLENIVAVELKRRGKEIFYYRGKNECDFVVREKMKPVEAIQVCYELNEENKKRELKGLKEAMDKLNIKKGLILTYDQEETIEGIRVMPVWKWLLE
ncbi:MAG: AAA family ATPase, partial [Nitrospiraceae bacterium]|nr:AAA family ATPase [Nitrospiraceae bacterium]